MAITDDKHCEILAASIRDHNTRITQGFKLFVQMFSLVAGGASALRLWRTDSSPPLEQFARLADVVILLVSFASALIIVDSFRGWKNYRRRLSEVAGADQVPPPNMLKSWVVEGMMLAAIAIAAMLFVGFNPFRM